MREGNRRRRGRFFRPIAEFAGQPFEQLEVARPLALRTEVIAGLHQARPEQHLPEAVYGHTAGQRLLRAYQPFAQSQTVLGRVGWPRRQRFGRVRRDFLALVLEIASDEDESVA